MWRPEAVTGPMVAGSAEIVALNRLFSDAFTERYRQDGLAGVQVPWLNHNIWEYALEHAGKGALIWRDLKGRLAAFNLVHCSGSQGWMGPIAVRTDQQGRGLGRRILEAGIAHLESLGATTIGLETMPRTVENIGFYSQLGFLPGHLTITLQKSPALLQHQEIPSLGCVDQALRGTLMLELCELTRRVAPGVDFTREIELTLKHRLGDLTYCRSPDGSLIAWVLWQTAPLARGHSSGELRVLKLVAVDPDAAMEMIRLLDGLLPTLRLTTISIRCQTAQSQLYARLIADGYRVHWTDLRVTLSGKGEPPYRGILLSNWEI